MTKSSMISILLCATVLVGATYFGDWTRHSYVKELTSEIHKASAVVKPKTPSSSAISEALAIEEHDAVDPYPKMVWDQMLNNTSSHSSSSLEAQIVIPKASIVPNSPITPVKPKQTKTNAPLLKNVPTIEPSANTTLSESAKQDSF